MKSFLLKTEIGNFNCVREENTLAILGLRYARAQRFKLPVVEQYIGGDYDNTSLSYCCPQYRQFHDESKKKDTLWYDEFRKGLTFTYSEDCLNMNIYAPENRKNCPVILFFHGGSFVKGSNSEKAFDGKAYAEKGVIMVTANYRLNVFGFYANDEKNLALYDMLAALDFVKKYIAVFGGNPDNITLMGQSAGAMSVQCLIMNPEVRAKVKGAIMMSGGGLLKGLYAPHSPRYIDKLSKKIKDILVAKGKDIEGCDSADLYLAYEQAAKESIILSLLACMPCFDDKLIKKEFYKDFSKNQQLPVIIGATKDDLQPRKYLFSSISKYKKLSPSAVYEYRFNRDLPGDDRGAWHSCDLWYAFGTLKKSPRPFTERDYAISSKMIDAFCAFAKDGKLTEDISDLH